VRVIEMGRAMGKTTKLIELSAKTNAVIICRSAENAWAIRRQAEKMDLDIPFPITFQSIRNGRHLGLKAWEYLIDDVDLFIESIVGKPVTYVTYTPR
jgi:hypothetical protein